jgi:OTT_1508-like deaminase
MAQLEITGNAQTRFIQAAVLLHLLDPVRGEPTAHGLDRDPHEIEPQRERMLKRKFLDSFALISATNKDGDTVSAASIEEGLPEETVVRVASNHGVKNSTLHELRELTAILGSVASKGEQVGIDKPTTHSNITAAVFTRSDKETEVLTRIISLDMARIRYYLKDLRGMNGITEESITGPESKMAKSLVSLSDHSAVKSFPGWIAHALTIRDLPQDPTPEGLVNHIRWALEARRTYLVCLKTAFSIDGQRLPRWVYSILKLGRYAVASMALLQLASEVPSLFNPMLIEPVTAPLKTQFAIQEGEIPLTSVLRRVVNGRKVDYVSRLARVWSVKDPETYFRNACTLNLSVRAEMQLLNFYDQHPAGRPAFRFISVSKKSCYLCQSFLAGHPQSLSVSSCHQKLYLSWRPPPTAEPRIYKRYKSITTELSKVMEAAAKLELESRLGLRRRVPPDSSAGVSLGGLVGLSSATERVQDDLATIQATEKVENLEASDISYTASISRPTEVVSLTFTDDKLSHAPSTTSPTSNPRNPLPVTEMVFHVMRANDIKQQDIIALGNVMDVHSRSPSWSMLLEVLKDDCGIGFKEAEEYLMFNDRIKVVNERQFLACVQYLRNVMTWNSDVFVYNYNLSAHRSLGSRVQESGKGLGLP